VARFDPPANRVGEYCRGASCTRCSNSRRWSSVRTGHTGFGITESAGWRLVRFVERNAVTHNIGVLCEYLEKKAPWWSYIPVAIRCSPCRRSPESRMNESRQIALMQLGRALRNWV
jgi:hypothetical protein